MYVRETASVVCVYVCVHPTYSAHQSTPFGYKWVHQPGLGWPRRTKVIQEFFFVSSTYISTYLPSAVVALLCFARRVHSAFPFPFRVKFVLLLFASKEKAIACNEINPCRTHSRGDHIDDHCQITRNALLSAIVLPRLRYPFLARLFTRCFVFGSCFCFDQLYGKVVPDTVKNFVALVTGKNSQGVSYQGTEAYRVLDGLNIQVQGEKLKGAQRSRNGRVVLCYLLECYRISIV